MQAQETDAFQNDDKLLVFTATTNGSISGWALEFVVVNGTGTLKFKKTTSSGITITNNGSSTTPGIIQVSVVDALELPVDTYYWQLRRTTASSENTIAFGSLNLEKSFRDSV